MANSYATMNRELRQRSVKIIKSSKSPYEVVGTGILLDSAHILTCYHVVLSALRNEEKNLEGDKKKSIKGSSVFFLGFSDIASKPQNTVVSELGDFQDQETSDYSNDLALLKITNPLNLSLPPLNWVQHELNAEFRMFSYRSKKNEKNPIGEELHGIAGEGVSRRACESWIRGASLANVDNKKPLAGASGSAMFAANANPNNLSCYGVLIASEGSAYPSKDGAEVNEQKALFIAAREVKSFLVKANWQFPDTEKVISSKGSFEKSKEERFLIQKAVELALVAFRPFWEKMKARLTKLISGGYSTGVSDNTNWQHTNVENSEESEVEKILSSKGYSPKGNSSSRRSQKTIDLALAMVDRNFVKRVEKRLKNQGLVCLVVHANEADWYRAIYHRLTDGYRIRENAGSNSPVFFSPRIDWPDPGKGRRHYTDFLRPILESVIYSSPSYMNHSLYINGTDKKQVQEGFKIFHNAIEIYSRIVIFIKLPNGELFPNEQEALETLIKQLQRYHRREAEAKSHKKQPEVLLYLVAEPQRSSVVQQKFTVDLRQLFTRKKNKSLQALTDEIKEQCNCFEVQSQPLPPIVDSDLDDWIETLIEEMSFDPQKCNNLLEAARDFLNSQQETRHKHFRDNMHPKVDAIFSTELKP